MKATIYYIFLTDAQRDVLNGPDGGWGCKIGKAYQDARAGNLHSDAREHFEKAATGKWEGSEHVWTSMQNMGPMWSNDARIECHTTFPRSMDVGDIIVWEDGRTERCDTMGFETLLG